MLKRKITKTLIDWKNEENKQCLLVRGARQVGKTFIINQFCKKNYESYIYINFELSPTLKDIFNGDLDADTLIMKLEVTFPNIEIKPGKTVLFLDEIQSCPNARVALKSFALDKRIDSKILLVQSERGDTVSVITSQNLTRGNRHESAFISTDKAIFDRLQEQINDLITNHSVPLHDLFRERIAAD